MAGGTIILRPSADIYVDGLKKMPADSSTYFNLVNEEVCDVSSTYVYLKNASTGEEEGTYQFAVSNFAAVPINKFKITGIKACIYIWGGPAYEQYQISLRFDEIFVGTTKTSLESSHESKLRTHDMNQSPSYGLFIDHLNNYIIQNGLLPNDITGLITLNSNVDTTQKIGSETCVSQIYFEFDYEEITSSLFDKVGGAYKAATAAYRKVGGAWSEIPEDEAKATIKNNTIRRGIRKE